MREVIWTQSKSPLGSIFVAAIGGRLVVLSYGDDERDFHREIESLGVPIFDRGSLRPVVRQLDEYFAGERSAFDVEIDLSRLSSFQRSVLEATCQIPYGMVLSYKEVAERIGKPGAARAVGTALGNNPIGIIVPCHRVIASDGTIGGYSGAGGVASKRRLLELEGVTDLANRPPLPR